MRALGADEVVDYRSTDFAEVLSDVDVVLGTVGGADLEQSLTVLAPGELAISVVGPPDPAFARQLGKPLLAPATALSSKIRWQTPNLGVRYAFLFMRARRPRLAELAALYDAGALAPALDRSSPSTRPRQPLTTSSKGTRKARSW